MTPCKRACDHAGMPKTVSIRDLDDETYHGLRRRAAEVGLSVPAFLRREAERLARRPSMVEWLGRGDKRTSAIRRSDVVEMLDELRGEWPHLQS